MLYKIVSDSRLSTLIAFLSVAYNMAEANIIDNQEQTKQEMEAVEKWLDKTEKELYQVMREEKSGISSTVFTEKFLSFVQRKRTDYEAAGFMKTIVQDAMDSTPAKNPFSSAKIGTIREKNNTLLNLLLTLETQQMMRKKTKAAKKEAEGKEREKLEAELREKQKRDNKRKETESRVTKPVEGKRKEPKFATPLSDCAPSNTPTTPLKLSDYKPNVLAESHSWYTSWSRDYDYHKGEEEKSWRVKI